MNVLALAELSGSQSVRPGGREDEWQCTLGCLLGGGTDEAPPLALPPPEAGTSPAS